MSANLQAQIAAAKAYEEFFVPALFGEWASRVASVGLSLGAAVGFGILSAVIWWRRLAGATSR